MEIEVKELSKCERVLEISMPPDQVKDKISKLYGKYQKHIRVNGFRKGMVPMNIIKGRFGKAIQEEAINSTIREAFREAIKEKNLSPITQGIVKDTKFSEQEFSFKVTFEVIPEISIKDYKGIKVKFPSTSVNKQEIESTLSKLQETRATYVPVFTRRAMPGDMLVVDYEILHEKRGVLRKDKVSNYTIILDNPELPKEISDGLVNSMVGDRRKVSLRYPTDFKDESLRGQWIEYEFVVQEIKEKRLPPIDDEFAKSFGFNSLAELTQQVEQELKSQKEREAKIKTENQIINSLIKENPFDTPKSIVAAYLRPLLERAGKDPELDSGDDETRKALEEIAIWRAKRELLLNKIAEIEKIEITEQEIKSKLMQFDEYKKMGVEKAIKTLKEKGSYDLVVEEFRREKVVEFLINNANI